MDKKQNGNRGTNNNNNNHKGGKPAAKLTPVSAAVAGVVIDEVALANGQDVDVETAKILEADKPKVELKIEPLTPVAVEDQENALTGDLNKEVVTEVVQENEIAGELPVVENENVEVVEMEVISEVSSEAEVAAAIEAAKAPGFFKRSLGWVANNKLKVVGGVAAVAAVGAGIYYLTRGGKADAAVAVVGVVKEVAEAATEAVNA